MEEKIRAEAWLFDARLWQKGKPTSFRLEIYRTDTVTALSGRGYLGKGAMKGTIKDDSLYIYFPRSNEYLYESASSLLDAVNCSGGRPYVDMVALLTQLPDSLDDLVNVQVTASYINPEKPNFILYSRGCPWELSLIYDRRKVGWRVKEFEFISGDGTRIKSRRRTFKPKAMVPLKRFHTPRAPNAVRIMP